MTIFNTMQKFQALCQLIALKATGTPKELARRLCISESTLYRLLDELKELGAKIKYNSIEKHYEFVDNQQFFIGLLSDEMKKIKGGQKILPTVKF